MVTKRLYSIMIIWREMLGRENKEREREEIEEKTPILQNCVVEDNKEIEDVYREMWLLDLMAVAWVRYPHFLSQYLSSVFGFSYNCSNVHCEKEQMKIQVVGSQPPS